MRSLFGYLGFAALIGLSSFWAPPVTADTRALWDALADGGHVAMIRHAYAPGTGDPDNFRIGDCSTQRNLSETGREQARRTGDAFRQNGVTVAQVLSSEWCRCQETAELLDVGAIETFPALNSLHQRRHNEEKQVAALKRFLKDLPANGPTVVFVSHHATVGALTGAYPQSGAMVVVKLNDGGGFDVVGSISPP